MELDTLRRNKRVVARILIPAALLLFFAVELFSLGKHSLSHAMDQTQGNDLRDINEQVWEPFIESYRTLDPVPMTRIHSKNLLRIPANAGTILDYSTYMDRIRKNFERAEEQGRYLRIGLRFFERIIVGDRASERGIYKLTITEKDSTEVSYFGQFHVILMKQENRWMITMDYDSDEGGTIGEKEYMGASPLNDPDWFTHH